MDYHAIYNSIINNRKNNIPSGYTERHHILPHCLGGVNRVSNLVRLTAKEHYICHLLLTKMYDSDTVEYRKMIKAFYMMSVVGLEQKRYVGKVYERIKIELSRIKSIEQTGSGNTQFGSRWIYSLEERRSKKIVPSEDKPDGWCYGRIDDFDLYDRKNAEKVKIQQQKQQHKLDELNEKICIAYEWYDKLRLSSSYSVRAFVRNSDYTKSHVSFIAMLKKYVPEFKPEHRKRYR